MKEILPEVEAWREAGEKVVVATVVATRRSAPRPVGTSLAVSESGKMCGSVSGGCVESDVYDNAMQVMASGEPRLLHYGITDDMAWEVGLPCGGEIDVFVETRRVSACIRRRLRRASREAGGRAVLFTVVEGDGVGGKALVVEGGETLGDGVPAGALAQFDELVRGGRNRLVEVDGAQGLHGVVRAAAATARLRRGGHRRGALPRREAARLDGDRRRRARDVPDARADALRRPS